MLVLKLKNDRQKFVAVVKGLQVFCFFASFHRFQTSSVSALMPHICSLTRAAVVSLSVDGVALVFTSVSLPEKPEQMEQPEATAVAVEKSLIMDMLSF